MFVPGRKKTNGEHPHHASLISPLVTLSPTLCPSPFFASFSLQINEEMEGDPRPGWENIWAILIFFYFGLLCGCWSYFSLAFVWNEAMCLRLAGCCVLLQHELNNGSEIVTATPFLREEKKFRKHNIKKKFHRFITSRSVRSQFLYVCDHNKGPWKKTTTKKDRR